MVRLATFWNSRLLHAAPLMFGVVLLLASIFSLPTAALAQEIYVVDIQEVIAKSKAGNSVKQQVEKEALKSKSNIETLKQEVVVYQEKLQKQASLLSEAALEKKKDVLYQKQKDLARLVGDEKESLQRESGKAVTKLVEQIQGLLPELVKETGAAIIIERDPQLVVFVSDKYDLTEKVVALLNERSVSF